MAAGEGIEPIAPAEQLWDFKPHPRTNDESPAASSFSFALPLYCRWQYKSISFLVLYCQMKYNGFHEVAI